MENTEWEKRRGVDLIYSEHFGKNRPPEGSIRIRYVWIIVRIKNRLNTRSSSTAAQLWVCVSVFEFVWKRASEWFCFNDSTEIERKRTERERR